MVIVFLITLKTAFLVILRTAVLNHSNKYKQQELQTGLNVIYQIMVVHFAKLYIMRFDPFFAVFPN